MKLQQSRQYGISIHIKKQIWRVWRVQIDLHIYVQLIFDTDTKLIQFNFGEKFVQQMLWEQLDLLPQICHTKKAKQKTNFDPYLENLVLYTDIKSKWVMGHGPKCKT